MSLSEVELVADGESRASAADAPPEQPYPLVSTRSPTRARVGELLPARRDRRLLPALRLPRVPKRAIFAVGMCAGLTVPAIVRHVAVRALSSVFGPRPRGASPIERASVEIIRVSCASLDRGHAAENAAKLIDRILR